MISIILQTTATCGITGCVAQIAPQYKGCRFLEDNGDYFCQWFREYLDTYEDEFRTRLPLRHPCCLSAPMLGGEYAHRS